MAFIPLSARTCERARSFVFRFESSLASEKKHLVERFFGSRLTGAVKGARIAQSVACNDPSVREPPDNRITS
jgi:hypothetical protein